MASSQYTIVPMIQINQKISVDRSSLGATIVQTEVSHPRQRPFES